MLRLSDGLETTNNQIQFQFPFGYEVLTIQLLQLIERHTVKGAKNPIFSVTDCKTEELLL